MTGPVRLHPGHPCWVDTTIVALLGLRPRQVEVLCGIARGRTNAQIAAELHLTTETVASHIRRLYQALGATDRPNAVALAYDSRLLLNATDRAAELNRRRAAAGPQPLPGQVSITDVLADATH